REQRDRVRDGRVAERGHPCEGDRRARAGTTQGRDRGEPRDRSTARVHAVGEVPWTAATRGSPCRPACVVLAERLTQHASGTTSHAPIPAESSERRRARLVCRAQRFTRYAATATRTACRAST